MTEIENLQKQLNFMREQLQQQNQSLMQYTTENQLLKSQAEQHKETIARLQADKLLLTKGKNKEALQEEVQQNKNLTIQYLTIQENFDKLSVQHQQLQMQFENNLICIKELQNDLRNKVESLQKSQNEVVLLNSMINEGKKQSEELKVQAENNTAEFEAAKLNLQAEIQGLRDQIQLANAKCDSLGAEKAKLCQLIEQVQKQLQLDSQDDIIKKLSEVYQSSNQKLNVQHTQLILDQLMKIFDSQTIDNVLLKAIKLMKEKGVEK